MMENKHVMNQGMEQKNSLSQDMQYHMKILHMSSMELTDFLRDQFISNPILEMDESLSDPSIMDREKLEALTRNVENKVERMVSNTHSDYVSPFEFISKDKTLRDYLIEQMGMMNLSEELIKVCEYIIFSLDRRGYFTDSVKESSDILGVSTMLFSEGLNIVREMDPIGIGWADVYETLIYQLDKEEILTENHVELIRRYLPEVGNGNFRKIEIKMNLSEEEVLSIVEDMRKTEPIPSRGFADSSTNNYVVPDLRIQRIGEELQITMSAMKVPKIRISEEIKELLKDNNPEIKEYLNTKLQDAMKLLKSIDMRKSTIERVTEIVIKHQKDYLMEKSSFLNPLSMKTIAEELEVHESTISRAVREKYLCTPRGTISLKSLFSGSHTPSGKDLLPDYIKILIKEMIEKEDETRPLSDQKITEMLNEKEIEISRRTVAKYREEAGIQSTKIRKRR